MHRAEDSTYDKEGMDENDSSWGKRMDALVERADLLRDAVDVDSMTIAVRLVVETDDEVLYDLGDDE